MKTFDEVKAFVKAAQSTTMESAIEKLKNDDLKDFEERAYNSVVQNCQKNIENIEEVTTIEIGATTNSLIRSIQKAYQFHLEDYYQNFEGFIDDYVVGIAPDGSLKNGAYFGQAQCFELGIGVNELLCFKGRNPMLDETGDLFRQTINANYGTNIPMASDAKQALQKYEAVAFGDDEEAKDQVFIHLKEVQRDSGILRNGGEYYILANDQAYQEAIERCSERSI